MIKETREIIESLSPNERRILPFIKEKVNVKEIEKKSGLDETSVTRALLFLENKKILKLSSRKEKIVDLGDNGVIYLKNGLPERKLLNYLAEKKELKLQDSKLTKLSDNEFKAAFGALKKKAMIEVKDSKIILQASMTEIGKKTLEEQFLEALPLELDKLKPEQLHALKILEDRKDIIQVEEKKEVKIELTSLGRELTKVDLSSADKLIENLTPEMIKEGSWKNKKFRRYDITSRVPEISGGKRHFVNQSIDYARKIWIEIGFKEMPGNLVQTSFWNFDALFTAQDHPVREMQDTFFIDAKGKLPDKKIVESVKKAHESGVGGSKGWKYSWKAEEAEKVVLRTHTTCLSAQTLAKLKDNQGKFFAIGKCFRNETLDLNHLFELTQTEGIVIGENANLRNLIGYLTEFYKKMGYEKVRVRPSYFPYTEPSLEVDVFDQKQGRWLELGGAGIFRPEVTIPLLGKDIPVLAWGQGFERIIKEFFKIEDIREMYHNDITKLRKIKIWS